MQPTSEKITDYLPDNLTTRSLYYILSQLPEYKDLDMDSAVHDFFDEISLIYDEGADPQVRAEALLKTNELVLEGLPDIREGILELIRNPNEPAIVRWQADLLTTASGNYMPPEERVEFFRNQQEDILVRIQMANSLINKDELDGTMRSEAFQFLRDIALDKEQLIFNRCQALVAIGEDSKLELPDFIADNLDSILLMRKSFYCDIYHQIIIEQIDLGNITLPTSV